MLILCSGADTYRSLEKARELERAYRSKYDERGASIERLASGKDAIDPLLSLCSGASLFSTRRFIRADGVISGCPKARLDALIKMLGRDVESTIVVSVEDGDVKEKDLKSYAALPKFVQYEFPLLSPAQFVVWATNHAKTFGFEDRRVIQILADRCRCDTWMFTTEFKKMLAGGSLVLNARIEPNVFEAIDALLIERPDRREILHAFDGNEQIIAQAPGQARNMLLAKAGYTKGMHPYVAQKTARMNIQNPEDRFLHLANMFVWSRSGFSSADEALDLLG